MNELIIWDADCHFTAAKYDVRATFLTQKKNPRTPLLNRREKTNPTRFETLKTVLEIIRNPFNELFLS